MNNGGTVGAPRGDGPSLKETLTSCTVCILGNGKISAWRARGGRAGFRNFSPCIARARRAHLGLTVYPPSRTLEPLALDEVSIALYFKRKQKYQNGNIHRKLTVPTSVILPYPKIQ
jgi:hypothetical protein